MCLQLQWPKGRILAFQARGRCSIHRYGNPNFQFSISQYFFFFVNFLFGSQLMDELMNLCMQCLGFIVCCFLFVGFRGVSQNVITLQIFFLVLRGVKHSCIFALSYISQFLPQWMKQNKHKLHNQARLSSLSSSVLYFSNIHPSQHN